MFTRYFPHYFNKYNITNALDWKHLTYLVDKNDFKNYNDIKNIKLDKTSIYSLTPHHLSYQIIDIFKKYLEDLKFFIKLIESPPIHAQASVIVNERTKSK